MASNAKPRITVLSLALGVIAAAGGLWLGTALLGPSGPPQTNATLLNSPRPLAGLDLTDENGESLGLERLRGKWSLFFFGYTHCPDVCPTTLATLAAASRLLDDLPAPSQPQVIFVSVDPERDTAELLAAYTGHFDPDFLGASASPEAMRALAATLGVAYQKVPDNAGGYHMDHSAALFLLNPRGEFNAVFSPPHTPAGIASDYRLIIRYMESKL
jgi:protein SCO1/2